MLKHTYREFDHGNLEAALEHHAHKRIIVITDEIDEVDPETVKRAKALNLSLVLLETSNELLAKTFKHVRLERADARTVLVL